MKKTYAINSPSLMNHDIKLLYSGNRFFSERSIETGEMIWSFNSREGEIGPYNSKELAETGLLLHIERCKLSNLDGGRSFELTRTHRSANTEFEVGCSSATSNQKPNRLKGPALPSPAGSGQASPRPSTTP